MLALVATMTGVSAVRNAERARDAAAEALYQQQVALENLGSAEFYAEEARRQQERAVQEQKRAADAAALARQQEELAKDR